MFCAIYRGRRRSDTYLYVPVEGDFSSVPREILAALGEPVHVMNLTLTPDRRLARADARTVMRMLLSRGCYVQLPPQDEERFV